MGILSGLGKGASKAARKAKTTATKRKKNLSELRARQAKEKKESKQPTQKNLPNKMIEREGAQKESFKAGQPAAGEGPVTVGKASGDIENFTRAQMEELSPKRRAAVTEYFRKGESFKGMSAQKKRDAEYGLAHMRKEQEPVSISTRQAISEGGKKARAAGGVDNYRRLLDDGVVSDDMTPNQIKLAIQNAKVRAELAAGDKNKAKRITEAVIESRDQKKFSRPRGGLGQPAGHGGPEIFTPKAKRRRKRPMIGNLQRRMTGPSVGEFKRGGLAKKGHKDYRKGGMFY